MKLVPKIEHISLYSKAISSGRPFLLNGNPTFKPSEHRLFQLLEAVVFHMLCIIDCLKQGKEVPQLHSEFFEQLITRLGEAGGHFDCERIRSRFAIPFNGTLRLGYQCFLLITKHIGQPYTEDDLVTWLESCSAPSITSSVSLVTENTPAFVLFDILLRSPTFKEQFLVQLELWTHNINYLTNQMRKDPNIIKAMLDNLTYYAVMFEPHSLTNIYQTTLGFSSNVNLRIQLGEAFFNDVIWNLAVYSLRYPRIDPHGIANAQELLMSQIRNIEGRSLSIKGYLGIAIVMSRISYTKGVQIFRIAEKRFSKETSSKKDTLAYYLTKIHFAKSTTEAVNTFKVASNQFDYSSNLWVFFIRKLKYMNVMDKKRAELLFKQICDSKVKVTSDIVFELLPFVEELDVVEKMFHCVSKYTQAAVVSTFRVRYMQLLKGWKLQKLDTLKLPWEKRDKEHKVIFDSVKDCITHIYTTSSKSMQLIVTYLDYVSSQDTVEFFELYQEEVLDKDHLPNAACLKLILDTAKRAENVQVRDNLFAPQLAIREFQRNVQANAKSLGIFPRDDLWVLYILLLAEFDYISELSKIIKWWIDLHFKPKKSTILCLLAALPEEFALRHIRHHQVAKLKKDWDWPTTREFKRYMWFQDQPKV